MAVVRNIIKPKTRQTLNRLDSFIVKLRTVRRNHLNLQQHTAAVKCCSCFDFNYLGMSNIEYKSMFALWCLIKSPLMLGTDLTQMLRDSESYKIISNERLIAVNQDPLGTNSIKNQSKPYVMNLEVSYLH